MFLNLSLADVFLRVRLGLWISGRKITGKLPSSTQYISGTCYKLVTGNVNLDHLAKVFVKFLHCPFPHMFRNKSLCTAHTEGMSLCSASLRREHLHEVFEILLYRRFIFSSLLIHSVVYFYFVLCIIIQYYLFYFVPSLTTGSSFSWLLCTSDIPSLLCFLSTFFLVLQESPGSACMFPVPA